VARTSRRRHDRDRHFAGRSDRAPTCGRLLHGTSRKVPSKDAAAGCAPGESQESEGQGAEWPGGVEMRNTIPADRRGEGRWPVLASRPGGGSARPSSPLPAGLGPECTRACRRRQAGGALDKESSREPDQSRLRVLPVLGFRHRRQSRRRPVPTSRPPSRGRGGRAIGADLATHRRDRLVWRVRREKHQPHHGDRVVSESTPRLSQSTTLDLVASSGPLGVTDASLGATPSTGWLRLALAFGRGPAAFCQRPHRGRLAFACGGRHAAKDKGR
jgi:hypothetical protein